MTTLAELGEISKASDKDRERYRNQAMVVGGAGTALGGGYLGGRGLVHHNQEGVHLLGTKKGMRESFRAAENMTEADAERYGQKMANVKERSFAGRKWGKVPMPGKGNMYISSNKAGTKGLAVTGRALGRLGGTAALVGGGATVAGIGAHRLRRKD